MSIFTKVSGLFKNMVACQEFANRANAAYHAAAGLEHPEPFTMESDPTNFACNQLGMIAADTIATQMAIGIAGLSTGREELERQYIHGLKLLADDGFYLDPSDRLIVATIKHGIWMGVQPIRDVGRMQRPSYCSIFDLTEAEIDKDIVQVKVGARFLLERLVGQEQQAAA